MVGKTRSKPYSCVCISKVYVCFSKPVFSLVVVFFLEQHSLLLTHVQVSLHLILVPRVCIYLDQRSRVIDWKVTGFSSLWNITCKVHGSNVSFVKSGCYVLIDRDSRTRIMLLTNVSSQPSPSLPTLSLKNEVSFRHVVKIFAVQQLKNGFQRDNLLINSTFVAKKQLSLQRIQFCIPFCN